MIDSTTLSAQVGCTGGTPISNDFLAPRVPDVLEA
jgi:hypothetical protein